MRYIYFYASFSYSAKEFRAEQSSPEEPVNIVSKLVAAQGEETKSTQKCGATCQEPRISNHSEKEDLLSSGVTRRDPRNLLVALIGGLKDVVP
jgi:hypothetical protein